MNNQTSDMPLEQEGELLSDAFIIRVWLEENSDIGRSSPWHGQITHVSSGDSRYVKDIHGLIDFVMQFLEKMGAKTGWDWRLKRWIAKGRSRISHREKDV